MRHPNNLLAILIGCTLALPATRAADPDTQDVAQEIGAVLAWRLGPEAVEEWCRSADPEGAEIRKQALQTWLKVNEARIKAVDSRIAEVVPLVFTEAPKASAIQTVHEQVKSLLFESLFQGKSPGEVRDLCKAEADPASSRWNNTGMPKVQLSLAALYDWQVTRTRKSEN
jgi:hypothetical protein